ncbi:hypothetical protein GF378_02685 [Candidatus Pacearchaeota archaeon]|nr:hypothetical protein [Candidatus Pacearchaeota archaeon]
MKLVGFNFTKISVERMKGGLKDLQINSNIKIQEINAIESNFMQKNQSVVKIDFNYDIDYSPGIAKLELKGHVLLAMTKDQAKELEKGWKKKNLADDYRVAIFNIILKKSNVKALELEEDLSLPFHLKFPTVKKPNKSKKE